MFDLILKFRLEGMHCSACSSRIEKVISNMPEVEKISVSLASKNVALSGVLPPTRSRLQKAWFLLARTAWLTTSCGKKTRPKVLLDFLLPNGGEAVSVMPNL